MNDYGKVMQDRPMAKKSFMNALVGLKEKASYLSEVQMQGEQMVNMLKMQNPGGKGDMKVPVEPPSPVAPDLLDAFYAVISEIGEKTALIQKDIEEVKQMIE